MEQKTVDSEVRIPLFDDAEEEKLAHVVDDAETVRYFFKAIHFYRKSVEQLEKDQDAFTLAIMKEKEGVRDHYDRQIQRCKERIKMHANSLWAIAAMKGLDKMSTPYGTVFQKQTTPKVVKNDEDALLKWVQENLPDAIVKVPKLDMRILSEMIESWASTCAPYLA